LALAGSGRQAEGNHPAVRSRAKTPLFAQGTLALSARLLWKQLFAKNDPKAVIMRLKPKREVHSPGSRNKLSPFGLSSSRKTLQSKREPIGNAHQA
jgi:hypothetical protein